MKILVANLGSTSFKYRLFDMAAREALLARGGVDRIGTGVGQAHAEAGGRREEASQQVRDHAEAVRLCLSQLARLGALRQPEELAAIGFKAVHARGVTGAQVVDDRVLAAMEAYNDVAPAHNPPYVQAMRLLARELPAIPLVAAFETGFHQHIDPADKLYGVPLEWAEKHGILRHGFHGASHRYIAERTAELMGRSGLRIISCHLGGSSSLCAIRDGKSVANSLGMSPQSGLIHNNRCGDFDPFALPALIRETGKSLEQLLGDLASRSGLLGLCGRNDLRDILAAADGGDPRASLALRVFVSGIRHYLGAYLVLLGGVDVIVFTGGIGEKSAVIRSMTCQGLEWLGIRLDEAKNQSAQGEAALHSQESQAQVWAMPTNEEVIVARQAFALLGGRG
jgi:acetate kinase